MRRWWSAASLAVVLPAGSIVVADPQAEAAAIALASDPAFAPAVVVLRDGVAAGSGVAVAPDWVLTAAHVVRGEAASALAIRHRADTIMVRRVEAHPGYAAAAPLGGPGGAPDLALLEVGSHLPVAVRLRALPSTGTLVTIVGAGTGGPGGTAPPGTMRAARNTIDAIGGSVGGRALGAAVLVADYDSPAAPQMNRTGDAQPVALEGAALGGDSGGGLFVACGDAQRLAAIFTTSAPRGGFVEGRLDFGGTLNFFVGLAPFDAWIDSITGASATVVVSCPSERASDR